MNKNDVRFSYRSEGEYWVIDNRDVLLAVIRQDDEVWKLLNTGNLILNVYDSYDDARRAVLTNKRIKEDLVRGL